MHEMSLCEGVLKILKEQAEIQDYSRVNSVTLEVGELSCAVPESMEMCFGAITRGTLADGAELIIVRTRGEAWCNKCEELVPVKERYGPCPQCEGIDVELRAGDALRIQELEVD
ncbi:MAG: hydrogenase maturation nickel metallochaperone HypA [Rhodospirillales bacterium]|nr:hydrogenase maturation nickel metallochaperone HypA [Rhodospirillales bacterium]